MKLTKSQIKDYQRIYKEVLGVDISEKEAEEKGSKLVKLIKLVYCPDAEYKN